MTNRLVFRGGTAWKTSLFGWDNSWEFGKPSWPGESAPFLLPPSRSQSLLCLRCSQMCTAISEAQQPLCLPALPGYLSQGLLAHSVLHLKFNIPGQILLGQSTGEPWSRAPFQCLTILKKWFLKGKKKPFPTLKKDELWAGILLHARKLSKKQTYKQHLHNRHLAAFSDIFFFFNLFWHAIKE